VPHYLCSTKVRELSFNRVNWRRLLHALRRRRMGIDGGDRRLICVENLYMGQKMRVGIDGEM